MTTTKNPCPGSQSRKILGIAIAAVVAGAASCYPVVAQAAQPRGGIEEIIVTAQKRSQSLNEVGMTITALDGDALQEQRITSLEGVARAVPGLNFTVTNNNTPVLSLRGVGFYDSSLSNSPAVSVYLDEISLPLPMLSSHTAFDLERIEVLKGPQGTLFGQNSTGGALNYIARKPTDTFSAGYGVSYGRFDLIETNAYVSGPLTENLRSRLALQAARGAGWQDSQSRGDDVGETEMVALRSVTEFEPNEDVRLALNINGWVDKSDPLAPQYAAPFPQQLCCFVPEVVAFPTAPDKARAADWSPNSKPSADNSLFQTALRAEFDIGNDLTLTSLSSYIDFDLDQVPEGDGTPFNILDVRLHEGSISSFTQEVRLANSGDTGLHWLVGVNYDDIAVKETLHNDFSDSSTVGALGITGNGFSGDQDIRNYAVFGNLEYELSTRVTLKAGARYTESRLESENCAFDLGDGAINGLFTFLSGLLSGQQVAPLQPGECFNMDAAFLNGPPFDGELKEDNLSWRIGLDYQPSDALLYYVNVAEGYKGGSFPVLGAASNAQFAPVTQESVLAYEAGFKASLRPDLQLNGAIFHYDYKDKQLKSKLIDPIFGLLDALVNVPETRLSGAELELSAAPVSGLSLQLSATYIDAEITDFTGVNNAGILQDFNGAEVPYTPAWSGRLAADYEWSLSGSLDGFVGASVTTQSSTVAIVGGEDFVLNAVDGNVYSNLYDLNSYEIIDLRAGVASADGTWRLTLFGRNVTDEFHVVNASTDSDAIVRYAGRPATWGISWRHDF